MARDRLIFFGELPPGIVHGVSLSNERMLSILNETMDIVIVEDKFNKVRFPLFYFVISLFSIFFSFKCKALYLNVPTSLFGLLRAMSVMLVFKLRYPFSMVVGHLHRGDVSEFLSVQINRFLFFLVFKLIGKLLVLSNKDLCNLSSYSFVEKDKLSVQYNFLTVNYIEYPTDRKSKVFSEKTLISVCNYIPTKGLEEFVLASSNLGLDGEIRYKIFGAVYDKALYQRLSVVQSGLGVICNEAIHGTEKLTAIMDAKFLVVPSLNEGMPLVILESLSQGTPVICFDVGSISEYLGENYKGIVHCNTYNALISKVDELMNMSYEDYINLSEESYKIYWQNYSDEKLSNSVTSNFIGD